MTDIFLLSRQKFNVSFTDLVKLAKLRLISEMSIEQAIRNSDDRDSLINNLRNCGLSLEDIGDTFGLTHERIRQLSQAGLTVIRKRSTPKKSIDDIATEIYKQAILDTSWWIDTPGYHGLSRDKVKRTIMLNGYTETEAEKFCKNIIKGKALVQIVLIFSHGVPEEKHREWIMNLRLSGKTQKEVLEFVNSKQTVKMQAMTWNRYCKKLGIREYTTNAGNYGY